MEGNGLCHDPAATLARAHPHTHTACTCILHAGTQQVHLCLTSVFPAGCVIPSPPNLPAQQPHCCHGHRGTHAHTYIPLCRYRRTPTGPAFTTPHHKLPLLPLPQPLWLHRCDALARPIPPHTEQGFSQMDGLHPSGNPGRDLGWLKQYAAP